MSRFPVSLSLGENLNSRENRILAVCGRPISFFTEWPFCFARFLIVFSFAREVPSFIYIYATNKFVNYSLSEDG